MWQQVRQRMCLHGEVPTGGPEWLLSLAFTSWLGFLPLPLSLSCSVRRKNWSYTEHLSGIEENMPRFLFVEHFNSIGHSLKDVEVHSSMVCGGNTHRKRQKIRLIFRLGTSQPRGLNALSCIRARIHKNWNTVIVTTVFQLTNSIDIARSPEEGLSPKSLVFISTFWRFSHIDRYLKLCKWPSAHVLFNSH